MKKTTTSMRKNIVGIKKTVYEIKQSVGASNSGSMANFDEVLGAASRFPANTMEEIANLLHKRAVEIRRKELAQEIKNARSEFKAGKTKKVSADALMDEIAA